MLKKYFGFLLIVIILIASLYDCCVYCSNVSSASSIKRVNSYTSLNDAKLLRYVEDNIYSNLVNTLDSEKYFVENIKAVYISKEYIEELEYNSKNNIYFGYTLRELDEQFEGKKYYFTLSENGETTVKEVESISSDDTFNKIIKNVAIGSGVILICVTVSLVTAGAPAVSMIFATSAKTATTFSLSSGAIGGLTAGIVKGIETGNVKEAVKKGMLVGSEGFKWGAISGAVKGGIGEAMALKGATLNGLTMNEAATIQKESGYPLDVIKKLHSMDEYNIYKKANLIPEQIDGHIALSREIDLTTVQKDGMTNAERIAKGLSPYDPNGGKYQLHHIGQDDNSPLAILEQSEHQGTGNNLGNYSILNFKEVSDVDHGEKWANVVDNFWKDYVKNHSGG